jgi:uncharacterized protein (PEP-CTERM system associated)
MSNRSSGPRLARLALFAPLPFVTQPALADWIIRPAIEVNETYTDNVFDSNLFKRSDWITSIAPSVSIREESPKSRINFDYQPVARIYAQQTSQTNIEQNFSGTGLVNLLVNGLFLDARAYADTRSLTGNGLSGTTAPENNLTQIYSYSISPFYRVRLGGTANAEARYRFTQTISNDLTNTDLVLPNATANSRQQTLSLIGTTGSELGRLEARGYAYGTQSGGDGVINNAHRYRIGTEGEYHLSHVWGLLAGFGYENVKYSQFTGQGTSISTRGPTWLVGIHVTPSEDSSARITYGRQDGINAVNADVSWLIFTRTRLFASWSEGLTTSAERIGQNVSSFEKDDLTGDPMDEAGRPLFNIDDSDFGLQNAVYRARGGRIGAIWTGERTTATISAYTERRTVVGINGSAYGSASNQNSRGVNLYIVRELTPTSSGNFNLGYGVQSGAVIGGGNERDWNVGIGYSRQLGEGFSAVARYTFYNRSSDFVGRPSTTNTVTVGLRKQF